MTTSARVGSPTWQKLLILSSAVHGMNVRDKRRIFQLMRTEAKHADVFLPHMGMTISVFCVFQLLGDSQRRLQRG